MTETAYFLCHENDRPVGGDRKIYRFVDILNAAGRSAVVVHNRPGFRLTWFENQTKILPAREVQCGRGDLLVIPEVFRERIPRIAPGNPHLILNQNAYITYADSRLSRGAWKPVVSVSDTIGVVTVSEDSREYLEWCFADLPVERIRLGLDPALFLPPTQGKRRAVSFMPRRNRTELLQLLRILDERGALVGWELTPIDNVSEAEAARLLRESALFLSLSKQEGFGLPPLEAMGCGCVVVGYHGGGGKEFLRPGISYPIDAGDTLHFARRVEETLASWDRDSTDLQELGLRASEYARREYSQEQEVRDVLRVFGNALDSVLGNAPGSQQPESGGDCRATLAQGHAPSTHETPAAARLRHDPEDLHLVVVTVSSQAVGERPAGTELDPRAGLGVARVVVGVGVVHDRRSCPCQAPSEPEPADRRAVAVGLHEQVGDAVDDLDHLVDRHRAIRRSNCRTR